MSKYYKAKDVFNAIDTIMQNATEPDCEVIANTGLVIEINKLPTIEVSEDCISHKINAPRIVPMFEYPQVEGITPTLVTPEVSEDCISREYLKSFEYINKGDFNSVETIREWIDNAPSVVPSRAEGEWVNKQEKYQMAECSNCKKVTMHEMWGDKLVYYDYCPNCGAKMKV